MFKRPLCEMASGLILGILFMRYQKWYLAAVAAGILFGIVWNLWHNTIRNSSEKDSMANARAWIKPVHCYTINNKQFLDIEGSRPPRRGCQAQPEGFRSSVWDVFLYSFWQGHFIMHRMNHFVTHT